MAQTTVNQYFVARKSQSHAHIHPSKKRKVDASDIEANIFSKKKIDRETKVSRTRSQCKNGIKKLPVEPEASPLTFRNQKHPGTPEKTLDAIGSVIKSSPLGKVKVDEAINDQAKTILHSRGNSILQSSLQGKCTTSPAKASAVLLSMSPKKVEPVKELSVGSNEESMNLQRRKDMLRHKYSNLLKDESANVKMQPEALADTSRRNKRMNLRNKYKHLLVKEPSSSIGNSSMKLSTNATALPNKSPEKLLSSPQKAFEKYKHLTEKNVTTTFQLPQKYKLLLEMFRCADSVLFLLHQRSETCTFERLKKSVQSMCGRDFSMKHLANMKSVYPNGFIFRQEKGLYTSNGTGKTNNYQLTIEANYMDLQVPKHSIKNNSSILITRRLKFENRLLEITKAHHQKYIRKLNLKIDDKEIHRWHPHFKLEEVPDIEVSVLPKPPLTKSCSSAVDLLHGNTHFSPKVANALQNSSEQSKKNSVSQSSSPSTTTTTSTTLTSNSTTKTTQNSRLKGVSADLLERIRQKEQKKLELEMTRNPKQELRLSRMERLPEISRIIKTYFVAEKKAAITLEDCVQKLAESYGSDLHSSNLEEHIRLLAEIVPKWLQILPVRKCLYVKIAKNLDINNVLNILADLKKKEETKT